MLEDKRARAPFVPEKERINLDDLPNNDTLKGHVQ